MNRKNNTQFLKNELPRTLCCYKREIGNDCIIIELIDSGEISTICLNVEDAKELRRMIDKVLK